MHLAKHQQSRLLQLLGLVSLLSACAAPTPPAPITTRNATPINNSNTGMANNYGYPNAGGNTAQTSQLPYPNYTPTSSINTGATSYGVPPISNANTNTYGNAYNNYNPLPAPIGIAPISPMPNVGINDPVPNGYHRAMPGDTIYQIGRKYNLSPKDIITWNNFENPNQLQMYQLIRITAPYTSNATANAAMPINNATITKNSVATTNTENFIWPVKDGSLSKKFDRRGIEISGRLGDPVLAVGDGQVVYVGQMKSYGNIVLVKHSKKLISTYAQLQNIVAKENQTIKKGQMIGTMGQINSNESPKLVFQLRNENGAAVDPMLHLPQK